MKVTALLNMEHIAHINLYVMAMVLIQYCHWGSGG